MARSKDHSSLNETPSLDPTPQYIVLSLPFRDPRNHGSCHGITFLPGHAEGGGGGGEVFCIAASLFYITQAVHRAPAPGHQHEHLLLSFFKFCLSTSPPSLLPFVSTALTPMRAHFCSRLNTVQRFYARRKC